ncbi:TRAP transporter small permease [Alteribacillus bidgolensis]|uniref:TRAP-type C4-dicarboxylate transport system, small permease component n=1 Tax=Alteribacillus bidgolensis TaxID=930129 RepID=A0A1G8Q2A4_9BACI|nr:TRAP transporter small permease [Alteribacillus bidgolensis]SDI98862.1 TRAP-type C4-dicarboxylate transport system, small permease component [Alteribacillus bidgolensis]
MKRFISRLEEAVNVVNLILHHIANIVLCFVMLLITFDVIGRFFFNQPITGSFELTELGSAILVFFTFAITHKYKEHIAIGFAVDKMPHRVRHIIEGCIEWFIFVVIAFMSWHILNEAIRTMGRNVTTSDLSLPVYPFIIIASIGSFVFALIALTSGLKHFVKAVEKT